MIAAGAAVAVLGGAWLLFSPSPKRPTLRPPPDVQTVGQPNRSPTAEVEAVPAAWVQARAQVAETMKTAPERLSPTGKVEPFDKDSFEHDPEAYLSRIEPARCFQTAKPGPKVPILDVGSPLRTQVTQGDAAILWAKAVPNAPVTFTAFGGGYFKENGVSTVSVRADARGLASAKYTADVGITGDVSVVVGSPLSAGNQRFFIRVDPSVR
jgi:hypothetical protein